MSEIDRADLQSASSPALGEPPYRANPLLVCLTCKSISAGPGMGKHRKHSFLLVCYRAEQVEKTKAAEALAHDEGEVINDLTKKVKELQDCLVDGGTVCPTEAQLKKCQKRVKELEAKNKLLRESLASEYAHHTCPDCPGRGSIIQLPPDEWKKGE